MKNIFSKDKPDPEYEFTHIVNPKPPEEVLPEKIKESIQVSHLIIYAALVFLFVSNIVFFLLLNGYKSEIRNFPRKMSSMEKVLSGYADDSGKFTKDIKKVLLDFQVLNKKIEDSNEAIELLDRSNKVNTADISRVNKEINGLLSRFELLQNDLEKLKEGVK